MKRSIRKWAARIAAVAVVALGQTSYIRSLEDLPTEIRMTENGSAVLTLPRYVSFNSGSDTLEAFRQDAETLVLDAGSVGGSNAEFTIFGAVKIRRIAIEVVERKSLAVSGDVVGIVLFTDGILVAGTSQVLTSGGEWVSPAEDAGIVEGDLVTHIDGIKIGSAEHASSLLSELSGDSVLVTIMRGDATLTLNAAPVLEAGSGQYRLGMWVRDSTAGIGTLTFADGDVYGALGHGITDADTGKCLTVQSGEIVSASVTGCVKGRSGSPGELSGEYDPTEDGIGTILLNNEFGIYGELLRRDKATFEEMDIALKSEIRQGSAEIICTVDGGERRYCSCEIERISTRRGSEEKTMVIRVTDEYLLEKTGGIVQGMSGSPIIQNGKLIGAVTHVLVNDPTRGYGISIENMLQAAQSSADTRY